MLLLHVWIYLNRRASSWLHDRPVLQHCSQVFKEAVGQSESDSNVSDFTADLVQQSDPGSVGRHTPDLRATESSVSKTALSRHRDIH